MAKSDANICNQALIRLGLRKALIDDLEADEHEEAAVMNEIFANTRDACLAAFPWPFATLREALSLILDEPTRDGWEYVYGLPQGCLQEREIWQTGYSPRHRRSDQRDPFAIEKSSKTDGRVLLCDLPEVTLRYTAQVTDSTKFHPLFVDALAWLLAAESAIALTGKAQIEVTMRSRYLVKISEAQAAAFRSEQEGPEPDSEVVAGRL